MKCKHSRSFDGSVPAALDTAETLLATHGFVIEKRTDRTVEFAGRMMTSTRENPLRGATQVRLTAGGGRLVLEARLGGVLAMALFVCLFPLLLVGTLALFGLGEPGMPLGERLLKIAPVAAPWLVIGPLMSVWIRKRTADAYCDLLANVATMGRADR